jgi:hypothetical protein
VISAYVQQTVSSLLELKRSEKRIMEEQDKHTVKVLRNIPRSIGGTSEIGLDGPWISDDGSPKIWRLFIREGVDAQIDDGDERA